MTRTECIARLGGFSAFNMLGTLLAAVLIILTTGNGYSQSKFEKQNVNKIEIVFAGSEVNT